MVCGTFTIKGKSKADADKQAALFKANKPPPTSVTVTPTADSTFTVTAVFPPCPPGLSFSRKGADPS